MVGRVPDEDGPVARPDDPLASHHVVVVAPTGFEDDLVTLLEVVEPDPVDIVGGDADVAVLTRPCKLRVVAGSAGKNLGVGALGHRREVVDLRHPDREVDAVDRPGIDRAGPLDPRQPARARYAAPPICG